MKLEFLLFAATLVGVALFHHKTLQVALAGLASILIYKLGFADDGFSLLGHLHHEGAILLNLLGLLVGFELLADHFSHSRVPLLLPRWLPDDWKGGFVLLAIVFVISSFLDNIAAAMIGGAVARTVYKGKVSVGYVAAIVAASNAGGAGSVVGDTTTTMMWIDGISPFDVVKGFVGALVALAVFGVPAAIVQHRHQPIVKDPPAGTTIDRGRLGIVLAILAGTIVTNVYFDFPAGGVWVALLLGTFVHQPAWRKVPGAALNACFLLALVLAASLMPVEELPPATWNVSFSLGFVSAVFDNIPLTKLALTQGGYDWGHLAFHVGFGGSMIWFGSSAGVAISNDFKEAKNALTWLRQAWYVPVAYVAGSLAFLALTGWQPHPPHKKKSMSPVPIEMAADKVTRPAGPGLASTVPAR